MLFSQVNNQKMTHYMCALRCPITVLSSAQHCTLKKFFTPGLSCVNLREASWLTVFPHITMAPSNLCLAKAISSYSMCQFSMLGGDSIYAYQVSVHTALVFGVPSQPSQACCEPPEFLATQCSPPWTSYKVDHRLVEWLQPSQTMQIFITGMPYLENWWGVQVSFTPALHSWPGISHTGSSG